MGVIAKRPIANAVWKYGTTPPHWDYHYVYWEKLNQLAYPFLRDNPQSAVGIALRFTLTIPVVHTAILGTSRPGRWQENKQFLADGPLPQEQLNAIHTRWKMVLGRAS